MRILSFIAGAGDMLCGSCLRDNALAGELRRQGHDVILTPLYTPVRTDEKDQTEGPVFLGGISIYLEQTVPLFRRTPKFLDAIWDSPAVIRAFTGRGVEVDPESLGALTVSILRGKQGHQAKEIEHLCRWVAELPRPDLVALPYTLLIALARPLREAARARVVCTLQGEELFLEGLREPWRSDALTLIRERVGDVDAFIAVSQWERKFMSGYLGIPERQIHVVPLGIDTTGFGPAIETPAGEPKLGFLARIAPEKGLHLLADAVRLVRAQMPVSLEVAGYLPPEHRGYLAEQEAKLPGILHYRGAPDREGKIRFLQQLSVFSTPCTFDEPKGLPTLEAMACGVPVVVPRRGAFPEMIEATGGGLLVEPDSAEAIAAGLLSILRDPDAARKLSLAGRAAVHSDWTLKRMASRTAEVYESILGASGPHDTRSDGE
jgi:glycosyltransferase involved in cell wall biosynthesis